MSDEARNYVKKNSPFTGTTFWVHYVLADIANKQHEYELWVSEKTLMEEWPFSRTRIYEAYRALIEEGYLTVLQKASQGKRVRYRFEFKGETESTENVRPEIPESQNGIPESQNGTRAPITITEEEQKPLAPTEVGRGRDLMFDALVEALKIDFSQLTKSARGRLNMAVKQLKEIDADPSEIPRRAAKYRETWPSVTLTDTALIKHWAFLAGPRLVKDPGFTQDELERWNETLAYIVNGSDTSIPRRSMTIIAQVGLPELKRMTVLEARGAFIDAYRASLLKE